MAALTRVPPARALNLLVSVIVITGLFAMMFKVLPDARVAWSDVWIGSLMTAVLFTIGKFAIGLYLGKSDIGSAYGSAASLVIVLLWVYYSAQIFLFGAEFTKVYANTYGGRIMPSENATSTQDPQVSVRLPESKDRSRRRQPAA